MTKDNTNESPAVESTEAEAPEAEAVTLQKMNFACESQYDAGVAYLDKAMDFADANGIPFYTNLPTLEGEDESGEAYSYYSWDAASGMDLSVQATHKKGIKTPFAVIVGQIPTLDQALANPLGKDLVARLITIQMNKALLAPVRSQVDGQPVNPMHSTLDDFFAPAPKAGAGLAMYKPWTANYKQILAKVKAAYPVVSSKEMLKAILESAAYASSVCPNVPQEKWVQLIGMIKAKVDSDGDETTLFDQWLDTRDQATMAESEEDADFNGLFDL